MTLRFRCFSFGDFHSLMVCSVADGWIKLPSVYSEHHVDRDTVQDFQLVNDVPAHDDKQGKNCHSIAEGHNVHEPKTFFIFFGRGSSSGFPT